MSNIDVLKAERAKRGRLPKVLRAMEGSLFPAQAKVLRSTSRKKAIAAGRRGGKTDVLSKLALRYAIKNPGETIPVLEKTLTSQASAAIWRMLRDLDGLYGIGCDFNEVMKVCTLPTGGNVSLIGVDTAAAADKVRGGKYPAVFVDEFGTIRPTIGAFLLDEVVEPALLDFGGDLILAGTPNLSRKGPFWEAFSGARKGYKAFNWDSRDNTALPLNKPEWTEEQRAAYRQRALEQIMEEHGWTWDSPQFVREYLGQWSEVTGCGVFEYTPDRNDIPRLATDGWTLFLAADLGFTDATAFVVWGRREGDRTSYVVHSEEHQGMTPHDFGARTKQLIERFGDFQAMVADTGGLGKAYVEQARQTFDLIFEPADKRGKLAHIKFLNGDLRTGRVRIMEGNAALCENLLELPWNDDSDDYADNFDDHLPDAMLYGHHFVTAWVRDRPEAALPPVVGTPEWVHAQERYIETALESELDGEDELDF